MIALGSGTDHNDNDECFHTVAAAAAEGNDNSENPFAGVILFDMFQKRPW